MLALRVEQSHELGDSSGMLLPTQRRILLNVQEATHGETPIRRHRFTIAHEIGHWVCHVRSAPAGAQPAPLLPRQLTCSGCRPRTGARGECLRRRATHAGGGGPARGHQACGRRRRHRFAVSQLFAHWRLCTPVSSTKSRRRRTTRAATDADDDLDPGDRRGSLLGEQGRPRAGHPAAAYVTASSAIKSSTPQSARSWHASEAHPLARPTLYVADHGAPAELIVRAPVSASLFSAESCTAVHVVLDGQNLNDIDPTGLGELIAGRESGHLRIELENHRAADAADVRAMYTVRIAIPDEGELAEVDQAFVRNLAIDRPSTRNVETFASRLTA